MSSVGQGIGGVVGGVIGFFVGGPTGAIYGAQAGMMVGGLLDPPKVQGPRLEDLTAQTSTYGAFIPRVYGTVALTGNVFWIQGDRLIEHSVESSGGKGGPEVTNFEYFATFAVSLCEGPIDGIRRIWVGGQLWYDASAEDLTTILASNESSDRFTLYLGTETQDADPLIQADRGVANVPAYRGLAYIVFNELPLKDFGNSIAGAQVKVEVIASGTYNKGRTVFGILTGGGPAIAVSDYESTSYPYGIATKGYFGDITGREWELIGIERATPSFFSGRLEIQEYASSSSFSAAKLRSPASADLAVDGDFTFYTTINARGHGWPTYSGTVRLVTCFNEGMQDAGQWEFRYSSPVGTFSFWVWRDTSNVAAVDFRITGFDITKDYRFMVSRVNGLLRMYVDGVHVATQVGTPYFTRLTDSAPLCICGSADDAYLPNDYATGAYVDVVMLEGSPATWGTIPLYEVVESECLKSELLTASDLDVTDLTDQVRGYRISSLGPLRGGIDPLRKAWPFDVVQHGYKIKFKARGGASVATITEDELDAREAGASPGVQVSNVREMDTVIPNQLTVKYLDAVREYDFNVAEETR